MSRFSRIVALTAAQMLAIGAVSHASPDVLTVRTMGGGGSGIAATPFAGVDSRTVTAVDSTAPTSPTGQPAGRSTATRATKAQTARISAVSEAKRVLVWFKPGVTAAQRASLRASSGVAKSHTSGLVQGVEYWDMDAASARTTAQSQSLVLSSLVRAVEPDLTRRISLAPNDPSYASGLWGMQSINAPAAWDRTTGSKSVIVAVIDTGVRMDHVDLQANIWTNPGEIPGNNIDDDNNGFVDDVHGWNFLSRNNNPTDDMFHGTHVAGTIGAVGNNETGVVGVNWNVSLMPLKVCNKDGACSMMAAMEALEYAVKMGARISNNSYGGGEASLTEQAIIAAAGQAGHVFVAAAGNEANDNDLMPSYPASYPQANIVSVEAIDESTSTSADVAADFTNYGDTTVDIAAPGVKIRSTDNASTTSYAVHSGTSMATPHVAGAAALLAAHWLQRGETWTVSMMKQRLMNTARYPATPLHNLSGGTLDLAAAINFDSVAVAPAFIHLTGAGTGHVTSAYGDCTARDCRITPGLPLGDTMTLVAAHDAGTAFLGWTGACAGASETCTVTLSGLGPHVTARFGTSATTTNVRTYVESATAMPAKADMRYTAFVKTVVSGDGNTRATARFYNDIADDGWCFYETSTTGGITIERKVGGVWVEDGPQIVAPGKLGTASSTRWFNCFSFGRTMTLSGDGSVLAVNLGAMQDTTLDTPTYCGAAVYRRAADGTWSSPTVLHPNSYLECWTPWRSDTLTGQPDWRAIALNDSGTVFAAAGQRNLRLFTYDTGTTWTLNTIPLPLDTSTCRLDAPTSVSLSKDGSTIAFAWPACLVIGTDPYGHPNPDLDQYARGRVLVMARSGETWTVTADLSTTDSYTVGTMGLGATLALSADGGTLVASFQRTWASVIAHTDYIGGAFVFERDGSGAWTYKRRIDNPRIDGTRMLNGNQFTCPVISSDGTRIVCGQPSTSGMNEGQGWFEVLQRNVSGTWADTVTATFHALNDGNPFDEARITNATSDASTVYAAYGQWRLTDHLFGDSVAGLVLTPSTSESTTTAPLLTEITPTPSGFTAKVANHDPAFEYRAAIVASTSTDTQTAVAWDSNTATVTVTHMSPASEVSIAVGTWLGGVQLDERGVTVQSALLPGNTPVLSAPTETSTGFTTHIGNLLSGADVRYASVIAYTTSDTIPIINKWQFYGDETITVTNLSAGSTTTLAVVLVQDLHEDSVATVTYTMPQGPALVPQFESNTAGVRGFTAHISNFSRYATWTAETLTTTSTVLTPTARVDTVTGTLIVTGIDPGESATVMVTASRTGYETGTETVTGWAMPLAVTPVLETTTPTADGFTVVISNWDVTHTWTAVSSWGGATTRVDSTTATTALARVQGVPPGTASTLRVYAARAGYESGTAITAAVQSITGAALVPTFDSPTATPHGFTVRITNSDTHFAYAVTVVPDTATANTSVAAGVVTVTVDGLASSETATITVKATRQGYETGTASVTGAALPPYRIAFVNGLGVTLDAQWRARGETVTWPAPPTLTGFTFGGWRNMAGALVDTSTFTVQVSDTMTAQWAAAQQTDTATVGDPASFPVFDSMTVTVAIDTTTAGETLTVRVTPVASPAQLAAGLIAVQVTVTNETGTAVTSFPDTLRIDLGHADTVTGKVAWTTDGTHWVEVPHLAGTTLPAGQGDGWFTDTATAHVVVLTRHLTSFGVVRLQSGISATPWSTSILVGNQTTIAVSGGNSSATVTFTSSTTGVCTVDTSGLVTGVGAGACSITVEKAGDSVYVNTVSATVGITVTSPPPPSPPPVFIPPAPVMLPALTPLFSDVVPAADGFTLRVANYDSAYAWTVEVSAAGAAATIDATGLVRVTGMQPDTTATVTVRNTRTGYTGGTATSDMVRTLKRAALVPSVSAGTATYDAFTLQVANYDSAWTWTVELMSTTSTLRPSVTMDGAGRITVSPLIPGASATVRVTAARTGYDTGVREATGSAQLLPGLTPTFDSATSKADGFTVRIANWDAAYTWTATTTQGNVVVEGALITVWGLQPSGFARVTVRSARSGFSDGVATSQAYTALPGAALKPTFESVTATADGFKLQIGNYNPEYAWSVTVLSADGVSVPNVSIDANGVVTVTGVAAGAAATVKVDTARTGYDAGQAELKASAMPKPVVKPTITVTGTALMRPVVVNLGVKYASKTVAVQIKVKGSTKYKALFTAKLSSRGAVTKTASVPHGATLRALVSNKTIATTIAK